MKVTTENLLDVITVSQLEDIFEEIMNENELVTIGGYKYAEGQALRAVDPVAFRELTLAFFDGLSQEELDTYELEANEAMVTPLGVGTCEGY